MAKIDSVEVDKWQQKRQKLFRSVGSGGKIVRYFGKQFFVYPNTFWPFRDSRPLIKNFKINKGESVLDVGTGSGVIAVFACYKGAGSVVAVDINPWAVKSARRNAKEHGFSKRMKVVQGDLFSPVKGKVFDVITANLPFRNKVAHDLVARSQWDTGFKTNTAFLKQARKHLAVHGRIYFAHANFGSLHEVRRLANAAGFTMKKIGQEKKPDADGETFYAFVLTPRKKSNMILVNT